MTKNLMYLGFETKHGHGCWAGAVMCRAGVVGCTKHNSISHLRLGSSGDAKTVRKMPEKKCVTDGRTKGQKDRQKDLPSHVAHD